MKRTLALIVFLIYAFPAWATPPPCPANVSPTPTSCWAYDESTGTVAFDAVGANNGTFTGAFTLTGSGVQLSNPNGGGYISTAAQVNPQPFPQTIIVSFAGTGGGLVQFANQSSPSASMQDYVLYVTSLGTVIFGAYNYGAFNVVQTLQPGQQEQGVSGQSYNDGNKHTVVASIGPAGMNLYIDGLKVGSRNVTQASGGFPGYWTVGAANTTTWPVSPGYFTFNGTIYYAAVWQGTQLTDSQALLATGLATPTPINIPMCSLGGTIASLSPTFGFAYANQNITFVTNPGPQLPNGMGAQLIATSSQTVQTDSQGNLPAGFALPQGAHVTMTIGSGTQPSQQMNLVIPLQTSTDLASLILAQVDPPQVVSSIAVQGPTFAGATVQNPAPGQIGVATLTGPNSQMSTCGSACTITPSTGPIQSVTLAANSAISLCGMVDGQLFSVDTAQNSAGGFTPVFSVCSPFTLLWNAGAAIQPAMVSTAPNTHQVWTFLVEGNTVVGSTGEAPGGSTAITATQNFNNFSAVNVNQIDTVQLSPPATLNLTPTCTGTCATTYTYQVTCLGDRGETTPISATTNNNSSLSVSTYNTVAWSASTGCVGGYNVYGRTNGAIGLLATVTSGLTYQDTGAASPGVAPPISNSTGQFQGSIALHAGSSADFANNSAVNLNQIKIVQLPEPQTLVATATCSSGCSTPYTYEVTCLGDYGETTGPTTTASNNATLSSTNFNTLTWADQSTCVRGYNVYGRTSGSLGLLATVNTPTYTDQGAALLAEKYKFLFSATAYPTVAIWDLRGTATTGAVDATTANTHSGASLSATGYTSTANHDLDIPVFAFGSPSGTFTPPGGFSSAVNVGAVANSIFGLWGGTEDIASAGAVATATGSTVHSSPWAALHTGIFSSNPSVAVTVVGTISATGTSMDSFKSVTVADPTGTTAGDLELVCIGFANGTLSSVPSSFVPVNTAATSFVGLNCYTNLPTGASPAPPTINTTGIVTQSTSLGNFQETLLGIQNWTATSGNAPNAAANKPLGSTSFPMALTVVSCRASWLAFGGCSPFPAFAIEDVTTSTVLCGTGTVSGTATDTSVAPSNTAIGANDVIAYLATSAGSGCTTGQASMSMVMHE